MVRIGSLLMVFVLALAGDAICGGQTLLRWKFEAGQVRHLSMTQVMKQTMKVGDQAPTSADATNTMDMTWKVESVDRHGVATLTQTFDRIRMKMQGAAGMTIDFDSKSTKEPEGMATMVASMMKPLLKAPLTVKMTDRGDVLDVTLSEGIKQFAKSKALGGIGEILSKEGIKKLSGVGLLPEKPVTVGDTWLNKTEMKLPLVGTIVMELKYTYLGPEQRQGKELQKIGLAMHSKPGEKKKAGSGGITQSDSEGTIYFDNQAGCVAENESTTRMKMDMNLMGQKMAMSTETTTKSLVSVEKARSPTQ